MRACTHPHTLTHTEISMGCFQIEMAIHIPLLRPLRVYQDDLGNGQYISFNKFWEIVESGKLPGDRHNPNLEEVMSNLISRLEAKIRPSVQRVFWWAKQFAPFARVLFCSVTERPYWDEYTRQLAHLFNKNMERSKFVKCIRTYRVIRDHHYLKDKVHYSTAGYDAIAGQMHQTIWNLERTGNSGQSGQLLPRKY